MEKGKLYIGFAATPKGDVEHISVYHGVKESNVEKLINKKKKRQILAKTFIINNAAKPMKRAMYSSFEKDINNAKGLF